MKKWLLLKFMLIISGTIFANSAPVVSNVAVTQRTDASKLVDITYKLSDADGDHCTITLQISNDSGSTWSVSVITADGDIGPGVSPGSGKHITWDPTVDAPGQTGCVFKAYITADDGYTPTPPDIIYIPGGTFQMGDTFNEGGSDELPVHTVTLVSFYMSRCEITNQQYCDFLNWADDNGWIIVTNNIVYKADTGFPYCDTYDSSTSSQIDYSSDVFSVRSKSGRSMANDPMVEVSWYGAVAYCNWRSQQEGKEPCYDLSTWACDFSKNGYHLPTEAQWEYAARGGLPGKRFPWGNEITHLQANYYSGISYMYDISPTHGYHPLWNDGIFPYTSPVGFFDGTLKHKNDYNWASSLSSYQTFDGDNGYGLYDMTGNVWEWCNDWYGSYSSSSQTNPTGPTTGSYRVLRSGSWNCSGAISCRTTYRRNNLPNGRLSDDGFRISLDSN